MNEFSISLRAANLSDLPEIQKLFVETIMVICKSNYSPEQLAVWCYAAKNTERWVNKINRHYFLVAEMDYRIIGFASLNDNDYVDLLFVHKDYQRKGVADKLYSDIEKEAIRRKITLLAILISCLGLFGLAAFTAEKRTKEIGIRKVLGSSEWNIIKLLSGDFAKMVLVAIFIALPISYYLTSNWLDNFAYKIDLHWWYFMGAGLLTMLISLLTVSFQSVKAAFMNPAESLRSE